MRTQDELRPVIVIGAARSGTKATRDALSAALGVRAVPYDIGYIWRHGNDRVPHDRLTPDDVLPSTRRAVTRFLTRYADADGRLIEKTVGNSLRVAFVAALLPNARFVHLIRDGVDVSESTRRQWLEPTNYRYLTRKLRHFPARLLPTYGRRYLMSVLRQRVVSDGRVATWGPRYPGIDSDLNSRELLTVCARQWRHAVEWALEDLQAVENPVLEVRYEALVADPANLLAAVADFAGVPVRSHAVDAAASTLVASNAGMGLTRLDQSELNLLNSEIGDLLAKLGYLRPVHIQEGAG